MPAADAAPRALVVGPGWRFTSGISYYTCALTNALAGSLPTDALLMRQLIPTSLYPGKNRVGRKVNAVEYAEDVNVYDGVDWYWGSSMAGGTRFLEEHKPRVVVLQWWTGAVLHSYLRLARQAKRQGAKVVMEWHEVQDTGEARIPGVRRYVQKLMQRLLSRVDAHVVHSHYDLDLLTEVYGITASGAPVTVIPHGPYEHVRGDAQDLQEPSEKVGTGSDPYNLLFFGVIRPYKGLEDLVEAFGTLPRETRDGLHLTIVGETWEGWDEPLSAVATSPARDQITVVNRYVTDAEAQQHFAQADAVVLPYRRSSSSGPLHMAMSAGLPVVVSSVGGLVEAAAGYEGVRFVPVADVPALAEAIALLPSQGARRFRDVRSWKDTVSSYRTVFDQLGIDLDVHVDAAATLSTDDSLSAVS
ncbi:glycosyltransferase [Nocardioides anomalus]|uniref:Glycosyltransferase n=1 Tax=Nocardioides anomalus TaxID=2712223 RepID=A0A6G6WL98_9ACTN|nr:glycosyltransferase [Nocardioides anomalus]